MSTKVTKKNHKWLLYQNITQDNRIIYQNFELIPHFVAKDCKTSKFTYLISKFHILIINSNLKIFNPCKCTGTHTHSKLCEYSLVSRRVRQLLFLIRHLVSPLILVNPSFRYAIPIRRDI